MNTLYFGMLRILFVFAVCLVFFSGCTDSQTPDTKSMDKNSSIENNENIGNEELPTVEAYQIQYTQETPQIFLSGTLTAQEEITIASEVTGRIGKVLLTEGESVQKGGEIMRLEAQTNLIQASYSSALLAVQNAQKSLEITKRSVQQDIANAKLQVENTKLQLEDARVQYQKVKDSQSFTKNTQEAQTQNAQSGVAIAEKNLELARKTEGDTQKNEQRREESLSENAHNTVASTLILLRSFLDFSDGLIGASELREHENDSFEVYLSGTSQGVLQKTQDLWAQSYESISDLDDRITILSSDVLTLQESHILLQDTQSEAKKIRIILQNIEQMLYGSIVSTSFPESQIENLKTQVSSFQQQLESSIQGISTLEQNIFDFEIQSPQRITSAQINVSLMESQLSSAQDQLRVAENTKNSSNVDVQATLENAKNAYLRTENALESMVSQYKSVELQAELAVQSARAQLDSAQASLDQASLNLSKLTITSGVKGTISQILQNDGDTVSPGTPLVIISDFSKLKLVSDVSIEESFLLKSGMKAEVSIDGVEKVFSGKISLLYPEADKVTKRVRVEISVPNTQGIPANIFATATLSLPKKDPKIFIPVSSLMSTNPPQVFVINENGVVHRREIEIGQNEEDGMVEVLQGLNSEEWIMEEKMRSVFEGDRVRREGITV